MNTIEALKANKEAFGLMSKELQDEAKKIGKQEHFLAYHGKEIWTETIAGGFVDTAIGGFIDESTYRLRPDYEDEPEILDYPIKLNKDGELVYTFPASGQMIGTIHGAVSDPHFIGLTAGEYLYGCLYRNKKDPTMVHYMIYEKDLPLYEVLAPTSVLFRK